MWRHIKQILQVIIPKTAMLVSSPHRMVLSKATKYFITFNLVHTTLPNYNWVIRISAHTFAWNSKYFQVNWKFKHFFVLFFVLFFCFSPSMLSVHKGNRETLQNRVHISVYHILQTLYGYTPLTPYR